MNKKHITADSLVNRLDVIAADRKFIEGILKGKYSPAEQRERVRDLLMPDELERYDAGMRLIKELGTQSVPDNMIRDKIDLTVVEHVPDSSAEAIRQWMKSQGQSIRLYGSMVDWLYSKDIRYAPVPADIDIATKKSSKEAAEQLANIIRVTSDKTVRVFERKMIEGYIVQIKQDDEWVDAVDVHHMDTYETKMPYGWETKPAKVIDGVPTEKLSEQLHRRGVTVLNPGVGLEGRGKVGPQASSMPQREKDIRKIKNVASVLIKAAAREGKKAVAMRAGRDLRTLLGKPAKGYPKVEMSASVKEKIALSENKLRSNMLAERETSVGGSGKRQHNRKHSRRQPHTAVLGFSSTFFRDMMK